DTRHVQAERIRFLERENAQIAAERDSRKVKFLWTPEIRAKFREAIETARERLLILSGFISSDVVNEQFETSLRNALNRGVRVWIGYGFDKESRRGEDQRAQPGWLEAENVFKRLKNEFPECFIYRDLQRSHEKRLICDNRFTFGGSFNLLSFSGEARRNRKLRHEGADLIEDAAYCDEQFDWYQRLFFS
ncbi:hypothetical protein FJZ36_14130, partial [Candidatus Poribacteria bacterium]|nr:hypothetical protein [Candidatus Poribacteria bacterium]